MDNIQERFEYKVQYGTGIQSRISKIHNSIENGKNATNEFNNLLSYLTDEIKDPIKKELAEISAKYAKEENFVRNIKEFPETSYAWSAKHKIRYIGNILRRIQTDAIEDLVECIMNRLNEMGLLGEKERKTQI